MPAVVSFDLFSALTDSRTGGAALLGDLRRRRGWAASGEEVYDAWDRRNKAAHAAQAGAAAWASYADLARTALAGAYDELGLSGDVAADAAALLDSQADWPLWDDVTGGLARVSAARTVAVLSNVDDDLAARTRAVRLAGPAALLLTSERLGAYKPDPRIYQRAREASGGDLMHVATSARDVRGALEAGLDVVRLRRPGHHLDPDGPTPTHEVDDLHGLADLLGC